MMKKGNLLESTIRIELTAMRYADTMSFNPYNQDDVTITS